ncbi:MAG: non-hydrolyzing UDP-N-acetylglucosamine 2-epimerase [Acidimicrobiales bacterium]
MRVATLVGTRPEIIKLSRVVALLAETTDHVLIHTGQNYDRELSQIFFDELDMPSPDIYLDAAGDSAAETTGNVIVAVDRVLRDVRPDALLILGDTNSALGAISAKRLRIPIFHMEAGNRCFDERVPEEINRRIVDHLSDINLPYTEHARANLLREGFPSERIVKSGSPQAEVLKHHAAAIEASDVISRLDLTAGRYLVGSVHREGNVDRKDALIETIDAMNAAIAHFDMPMILSLHPRTRDRLAANPDVGLDKRIAALPPLGLADYVALQANSYCVISDSGTVTEESSMLGFPAVTLREVHERPEGMDTGVLVMTGRSPERLIESINLVRNHYETTGGAETPEDYRALDVSWRVVKTITSYTDYVNRRVWREDSLRS